MEGTVPFKIPGIKSPAHTWYKVYGDLRWTKPGILPLVILHGGPGACHEYLAPLSSFYNTHLIPIVLYDQLGEGRSTHLPAKKNDKSFWTGDLFCAELDNLLDHLGLRSTGFDLLGQSWGGMLASFYAARRPRGLRKLVLSSAPASVALYVRGCNELVAKLPRSVREDIDECRRKGDFESDKYKAAVQVFYDRHMCLLRPWPKALTDSLAHMESGDVYKVMYGPSDLDCTGSLAHWSTVDAAARINVPTLLVNGSVDTVTDLSVQPFFDRIPRVRWVTIDGGSHIVHLEQPAKYREIVCRFLLDAAT